MYIYTESQRDPPKLILHTKDQGIELNFLYTINIGLPIFAAYMYLFCLPVYTLGALNN